MSMVFVQISSMFPVHLPLVTFAIPGPLYPDPKCRGRSCEEGDSNLNPLWLRLRGCDGMGSLLERKITMDRKLLGSGESLMKEFFFFLVDFFDDRRHPRTLPLQWNEASTRGEKEITY